MIFQNNKNEFVLPELRSSLPTGAVKNLVGVLGKCIVNGDYGIGQTIPMEPQLVDEHGVSRTVVREAIKVLSGKGLLRTARRYGTSVCELDEWNLLDPEVISWHEPESPMANKIFTDASAFRILIEPHSAFQAASCATDAQRARILNAASALENHTEVNESMIGADYAFHSTILEASDCLMLKQLQGFLHSTLSISYKIGIVKLTNEPFEDYSHSKVAQAIAVGDAELARDAMFSMQTKVLATYNEHIADKLSR